MSCFVMTKPILGFALKKNAFLEYFLRDVLLKMAANDFAEIIIDSDGEMCIMATREQIDNFLLTDKDEFIDL